MRVGNQIRFKAKPGTMNGHMAVELTQVLTNEIPEIIPQENEKGDKK